MQLHNKYSPQLVIPMQNDIFVKQEFQDNQTQSNNNNFINKQQESISDLALSDNSTNSTQNLQVLRQNLQVFQNEQDERKKRKKENEKKEVNDMQNYLDQLISGELQQKKKQQWQQNACKAVRLEFVPKPNKMLPLQTIYLLKNYLIIDEKVLKQQDNYDNNQLILKNKQQINCQEEIGMQSAHNQFKYVDYILHENREGKNGRPEFLSIMLEEIQHKHTNAQYVVKRFQSFGDKGFKEYADLIDSVEQQYHQFMNKQYNAFLQSEKLQKGVINYMLDFKEKIFQEYQGHPIRINYFRAGENGRLADFKCSSFNKEFVELLEYNCQEFCQHCMKTLEIPEFLYILNAKNFMQIQRGFTEFLKSKMEFASVKIKSQETVYFKTKNGNRIIRASTINCYNDGLNSFLAYIFDKE